MAIYNTNLFDTDFLNNAYNSLTDDERTVYQEDTLKSIGHLMCYKKYVEDYDNPCSFSEFKEHIRDWDDELENVFDIMNIPQNMMRFFDYVKYLDALLLEDNWIVQSSYIGEWVEGGVRNASACYVVNPIDLPLNE